MAGLDAATLHVEHTIRELQKMMDVSRTCELKGTAKDDVLIEMVELLAHRAGWLRELVKLLGRTLSEEPDVVRPVSRVVAHGQEEGQ